MNWRYRNTVLVLCTSAFFVTMTVRLVISPLAPLIIDEFGVSKSLIGLSLSGMWLAYALTQFPSGVLGEQYGERRIILLSVSGISVMSVLLALAPAFALFVACCVLLGGFAGLHYAAATTLLTRAFDRAGRVIGIHAFGAPIAGLVAPVAVTWIGVRYGWRPAVMATIAVSLPVLALFYVGVRSTPPTNPTQSFTESVNVGVVADLFRRPSISFTVGIAFAGEFFNQGLISFLPVFLVQYHGYTETGAGALFSLFFLASAVGSVTVGSLSDRFGRDRTITLCMLLAASGLGVILLPTSLAPEFGALLLALGTCSVIVVQPRFLDEMDKADRGTEFGLVRTVYMILGSLGSVTVGLLAETVGWSAAFGILAFLCLLVVGSLAANRAFGLEL